MTDSFFQSRKFIFFLSVFFTALKIPFLFEGYGNEEDSWGLALATYQFRETGVFEVSRLPGHPVQELFLGILPFQSAFLFNFFSALFSGIAIYAFGLVLLKFKVKNPALVLTAFACVPVIFISGTYTIDYVWGLAFFLLSLHGFLDKKYILAGIFMGLAIGSRITYGAMLIPLFFLYEGNSRVIDFFKTSLWAGMVSLLCFSPIIIKYGPGFFMYYDQFPYPGWGKLLYKMWPGVWGIPGLLVPATGIGLIIWYGFKTSTPGKRKIILATALTWLLFTAAYFRLPQKSAYMIPVIPFTLILVAEFAPEKISRFVLAALILGIFLPTLNLTDPYRGSKPGIASFKFKSEGQEIYFDALGSPVLADFNKRKVKKQFTENCIKQIIQNKDTGVIICGWWYNEILVRMKESGRNPGRMRLVFYTGKALADSLQGSELPVYYLQEQEKFNDLYSGISNTREFARPFIK